VVCPTDTHEDKEARVMAMDVAKKRAVKRVGEQR
jgi:hypothetical protein